MSKNKIVLGKGLEALIPTYSEEKPQPIPERHAPPLEEPLQEPAGVAELPVDRIRPNPFQPREDFEPQALEELKQSIIEHGVLQPITVRTRAEGYELIAGERRLRAAKAAGLKMIPAYIKEVESDEELLELALIENVQREHLNPIEIATGYQRLIDECHLTQEEVAVKVSKDRTTVTNLLRLLKLPGEIQDSVRRNEITMGHARALVNIPARESQIILWKRIVGEGLSVRRAEALARKAISNTDVPRATKRKAAPETAVSTTYRTIESRLRHALATQVHIRDAGDGKGEIVVEFYSDEELERLLELMESSSS